MSGPGWKHKGKTYDSPAAVIDELQAALDQTTKAWANAADERDVANTLLKAANLQIDEMRELLSQYCSSTHLHKHDANIAPMGCQVEPCPKTCKMIYANKPKCPRCLISGRPEAHETECLDKRMDPVPKDYVCEKCGRATGVKATLCDGCYERVE